MDYDVVVAGGGPVSLMLACELRLAGRGGRGTAGKVQSTHRPFSTEQTITVEGRSLSRWTSATQARVSATISGAVNSNGFAVRSSSRFQASVRPLNDSAGAARTSRSLRC
ncbi:hypothetical protein [Streptomyces sp. NPDC050485]|uniref:hypothetical protein n=1 Tax=Streptomyces sp. NPDC050485 TaxID=3365617 RepID=UPI0037A70B20